MKQYDTKVYKKYHKYNNIVIKHLITRDQVGTVHVLTIKKLMKNK